MPADSRPDVTHVMQSGRVRPEAARGTDAHARRDHETHPQNPLLSACSAAEFREDPRPIRVIRGYANAMTFPRRWTEVLRKAPASFSIASSMAPGSTLEKQRRSSDSPAGSA